MGEQPRPRIVRTRQRDADALCPYCRQAFTLDEGDERQPTVLGARQSRSRTRPARSTTDPARACPVCAREVSGPALRCDGCAGVYHDACLRAAERCPVQGCSGLQASRVHLRS